MATEAEILAFEQMMLEEEEKKKKGRSPEELGEFESLMMDETEGSFKRTPQKEYAEPTLGNQALHVAKGLGRMALDTANLPYYAERGVNFVGERMGAEPIPDRGPWTQILADKIGGEGTYRSIEEAIAGDVVDPSENRMAEALRTGVEWGALGPISATRKAIPKLADEINYGEIGSDFVGDAAPDVAIGATAASGGALADSLGGDWETGELMSGMSATLASVLRGRRPSASDKAVENLEAINARSAGVETGTAESRALLDESVERAKRSQAAGNVETTADAVGTDGMRSAELLMRGQLFGGEMGKRLDDIEIARNDQIAQRVKGQFGDGEAAAAEAAAKRSLDKIAETGRRSVDYDIKRIDTEEAADIAATEDKAVPLRQAIEDAERRVLDAEAEAATASQVADEIGSNVAVDKATADISKENAENLNAVEKAYQEDVVDKAYDRFKQGKRVLTGPLKSAEEAALEALPIQQREILEKQFGPLLKQGEEWKKAGSADPVDVSEYFQSLRDAVYEGVGPMTPMTTAQKNLKKILEQSEDALGASNELFEAAKKTTRIKYERFRDDSMMPARKADPERFFETLGTAGDQGAVTARLIEATAVPELQTGLIEYMRGLANKAPNGVDAAFLNTYEGVLSKLPQNVQEEFLAASMSRNAAQQADKAAQAAAKLEAKNIAATGDEVKGLEKAKAERAKAAEAARTETRDADKALQAATQKTAVGRYNANPAKELDNLLSSSTNTRELKALQRGLADAGEPDVLKAAVRDRLDKRILQSGSGRSQAKAKDLVEVRDIALKAQRAGILTADESKNIIDEFSRTLTQEDRLNAIRSVVGQSTSEFDNLAASGIAALILQGVGGTQSLIVGSALRRTILKYLRGKDVKPREIAIMEDMIADPAEYVKRVEGYDKALKAKKPETAEQWAAQFATKLEEMIKSGSPAVRGGQIGAGFDETLGSGDNRR